MMESELAALAASNQQLHSQLDMTVSQLSKVSADKLAAHEAAADASERLQQELDVLRSTSEIDADIRKELEASLAQVCQGFRGVGQHAGIWCSFPAPSTAAGCICAGPQLPAGFA
jgi:hypothetical protein